MLSAAATVARDRWTALPPNLRGAVWVLLASAGFSLMASLVKLLGQTLDSFQIVFFRCVVGLAVMLPVVARMGPRVLRTDAPFIHLGRALAGLTAMSAGFYALSHLPLATATAITFTKPLFLIIVAALLLGERVGWRRLTATGTGFVGVLIMLRPGAGLDPAMLAALLQALSIAMAVVMVKKLPAAESTATVLISFAVLSTLFSVGPALAVWRSPTPEEWLLAVAMGLLGTASQAAIVRGYRTGEATALAPFDYARLVFASLLGLVLFAELPDAWTWAGVAVIMGSSLYIARREARLGRTRPMPVGGASGS